jgi:hypothetical protein
MDQAIKTLCDLYLRNLGGSVEIYVIQRQEDAPSRLTSAAVAVAPGAGVGMHVCRSCPSARRLGALRIVRLLTNSDRLRRRGFERWTLLLLDEATPRGPSQDAPPPPAETDTEKAAAPDPEKAAAPDPEKAAAPDTEKAAAPDPEKAAAPDTEKAAAPDTEKAAAPDTEKAAAPAPAHHQPDEDTPAVDTRGMACPDSDSVSGDPPPAAPKARSRVTVVGLLEQALQETRSSIPIELLRNAPRQTRESFGTTFVGLASDFFTTLSQLSVFYRAARLGLVYAHAKAVHPAERKELTKAIQQMHAVLSPVMVAWGKLRSSDLSSVRDSVTDAFCAAVKWIGGACVIEDGCLHCSALTKISDRFIERGIAFGIARVGSVMLLLVGIVLRLMTVLLDFARTAVAIEMGTEYQTLGAIRDVLESTPVVDLPIFTITKQVFERLRSLSVPDAELTSNAVHSRKTSAERVRCIEPLPVLGELNSEATYVMFATLYIESRALLTLVMSRIHRRDIRVRPSEQPKNYRFVSESNIWTNPKYDRYTDQRWEVHPLSIFEQPFALMLTELSSQSFQIRR